MPEKPPGAREPLLTYLAATALASGFYWSGQAVPVIGRNVHALIALVFLYAPAAAERLTRRPFDYREAGMRLDPIPLGLKVLGAALGITWPIFAVSFFAYYGVVCNPARSAELGHLCPGLWRGARSGVFALPDSFALLALSQVVVVAVPEELFFRGYLMTRIEALWPSKRRLWNAPVGWPLLVSSVLFACGHVLVDFNPQRLSVFFPALVFGWMRARTGSIAAGALFHALCNLYSDVLHNSYF